MKVCPFTVSYIYAISQKIYMQFCGDLEINVLLLKFLQQELLFVILVEFTVLLSFNSALLMDIIVLVLFIY